MVELIVKGLRRENRIPRHGVILRTRPEVLARGPGLVHQVQVVACAHVRELTKGRGVDVAYDSIGRDTFMKSIECLRPRGLMVAYGNASGKPDPFDVLALSRHGSLYLTRPNLGHYVSTRADLELSTSRFFDALERGIVWPHPVERFALEEAPAAHLHLEDRAKHTIPILVP